MLPEQANYQIGQSVGAKLRAARIANKLTQSQLASPDFSVSYISAIERGQIHPSLRALEILATRLGLSSTQLLPYRSPDEGSDEQASHPPLHGENETDITILEAQICIWKGEAESSIGMLRRQLQQRNLNRQQQVHLRYLLGWAYLRTAQLQESEQALAEAEQNAKDQNLPYLNARILALQGNIYAAMRNYTHALNTHKQCLTLLEQQNTQDVFFISQIYSHLGQHYNHLNNSEMAIEMFQQALSIVQDITDSQKLERIYWNISQHYVNAMDYPLATLYAHKCMQIRILQSYCYTRSEIYHYLGRAELKGDMQAAQRYLEKALEDTAATHDQLAQACVTAQLAEWHFMQHDLVQAESEARQANLLASKFGDTLAFADTYLVLGHICYAKNKYQEGDDDFVSGLNMLERLQAQEEYADQAAQYAQLLEEQGKVYEALAYFRKAYESRQKISRQAHQ